MFALSNFITNTDHSQASRLLLRRLIVHTHHVVVGKHDEELSDCLDPHVPNVSTLEGARDLFLLCIFAELGELLDPAAYKKQHRDSRVIEHDRLSEIHTRGLARELADFWGRHFEFFIPSKGSPMNGQAVFLSLLAHHVKVLTAYKKLAEKLNIQNDDPACTAKAFESFIEKYFRIAWSLEPLEGTSSGNFDWSTTEFKIRCLRQNDEMPSKSSKSTILPLFCTDELRYH